MCNYISYIIIIHALYPTDWFLECCSRSNPLSYSCYFTPKICTVIDFKRTYLIINIHFFIIFASILSNLKFWILFRKMCKMSDWLFICLCCFFVSLRHLYTKLWRDNACLLCSGPEFHNLPHQTHVNVLFEDTLTMISSKHVIYMNYRFNHIINILLIGTLYPLNSCINVPKMKIGCQSAFWQTLLK